MWEIFGNKKSELGTREGKLGAMRPAQREFFATVKEWNHAQELMSNAEPHFIASAIHEVNATEAKLNSLIADQRGASALASFTKRFAANKNITQVAKLSRDGHILYNSRHDEPVAAEA